MSNNTAQTRKEALAQIRSQILAGEEIRLNNLIPKPRNCNTVIVPTTPGRPIRDAEWWEERKW